jgi:hypothetical protein
MATEIQPWISSPAQGGTHSGSAERRVRRAHRENAKDTGMTIECFAQRLLNPFRGCVNIIRHRSAEAVTADGVHWDIYVSNDGLLEGLPPGRRPLISDIRFGRWCAAQGLRRGPIYPSDDFLVLEALGQTVYEHLLHVFDQVPFPFRDYSELWLLDTDHQPLALLESAPETADIHLGQSLQWLPGLDCRRTFTSTAATELGIDPHRPGAAADYLGHYINARAAPRTAAQLFVRQADGSGRGCAGVNLETALETRTLPAKAFPPRLLRRRDHDPAHAQLVDDFILWQAPWQLLLEMDAKLRGEFEQHACSQPMKVAAQYRLYPDITRPDLIDAARVETRLRTSIPAGSEPEQVMSTDYLELAPDFADQRGK